ncbi:unnamed protein product [marine sediment metagenome]|uniref:Uncharacterized protein n=1 Tax=marine sediment metagenome TaxID=412755 RepID=X0TTY3_9ZZZZ
MNTKLPTKRALAAHIMQNLGLSVTVRESNGQTHYSGDPIHIGVRIDDDGIVVGHYYAHANDQQRVPIFDCECEWLTLIAEGTLVGKLFHRDDVLGVITELEKLKARQRSQS